MDTRKREPHGRTAAAAFGEQAAERMWHTIQSINLVRNTDQTFAQDTAAAIFSSVSGRAGKKTPIIDDFSLSWHTHCLTEEPQKRRKIYINSGWHGTIMREQTVPDV